MWEGLAAALAEVADRPDDRVLVVAGAGDAFCSGADLSSPGPGDRSPLDRLRLIGSVALALHRLPKPTVAKVGGVAAGAGCKPGPRLRPGGGLRPGPLLGDLQPAGAVTRLRRLLAPPPAGRPAPGQGAGYFAEVIDAAEAERMGLVNRVVPAARLDAVVDDWARRLAAGPALALARTKALLHDSCDASFEVAVEAEARAQAANMTTADFAEAMVAFVERRDPWFGSS